ncbi:polynucleotide adenylyltransferase PcnB [Gilvimarinus sp. F26214L]|uniref:polynucleotide adenylyltransferase PcnB n=1 Tax=Gilvimarinus sp. DZF01 TaxID=3461371 RepID=UPI0040453048
MPKPPSPGKDPHQPVATAVRLKARNYGITPDQISPSAVEIVERLEQAGFQAYLVGGCVRDLLVGGHPKDFDIATSATPEEVRALFRRAHIIGRRFRIVHVRSGREITEVTTFRAHHENGSGDESASSEHGMLLRDNVYGDIQSDALRRDFTMNALYYSPTQGEIIDFTTGMADVAARQVKMIGDPVTRYQEDPVRMLRAVRLASKLGFEIEDQTAQGILELGHLLANVPPARLFDEALKLLMSGHAEAVYPELRRFGLFERLFPETGEVLAHDSQVDELIRQAAHNTDERIRNGRRVTPAFLFAVILWPAVVTRQQQLHGDGVPPMPALQQAAQWVISRQVQRVAIPKRFTIPIREIWEMQPRLPRRSGQQAFRLLSHPRFRAAYDFLLLREQAGEDHQGLGQWWTTFQEVDEPQRNAMVAELHGGGRKRPRKRSPRKRKPDGK